MDIYEKTVREQIEELAKLLDKMEIATSNLRSAYLEVSLRPFLAERSEYNQKGEQLRHDLYEKYRAMHGYEIHYEDGILKLQIPFHMPHRKAVCTHEFDEMLQLMLEEYCQKKPEEVKAFQKRTREHCVLVINHLYTQTQLIRDNDNIQMKRTIDRLIVNGMIPSDTGTYLSIYTMAECKPMDGKAVTELFLMGKDKFIKWLLARNKYTLSGF